MVVRREPMTVKDLIELLSVLPQDAIIFRDGGEFKDNYVPVRSAQYKYTLGWGMQGVLIE